MVITQQLFKFKMIINISLKNFSNTFDIWEINMIDLDPLG